MKVSEQKTKENNRDYALRILKENIINLELKPPPKIMLYKLITYIIFKELIFS